MTFTNVHMNPFTALALMYIFFPGISLAQNNSINIKSLAQTGEYTFPFVVHPVSEVSEKINIYLQTRYLLQVPEKYTNNDPYHFAKNGDSCGQTIYQDFTSDFPNPSILAIKMDIEQSYCTGMGLDWLAVSDYFDLHTGEKIELYDLFSKTGYREFKILATNIIRKVLEQYIHTLGNTLKDIDLPAEELTYAKDQRDFYADCLQNTDTAYFGYYEYQITRDGLMISRNHCYWNETGRALDENPVPKAAFTFKNIAPMLSAYGKDILLTHEHIANNPSLKNKVFRGLIDEKYAITAIVQKLGTQTEILYWYDKVRQPLIWQGRQDHETYQLTETILHSEKETGNSEIAKVSLKFSIVDGKWVASGSWKILENSKVLSVRLYEYGDS